VALLREETDTEILELFEQAGRNVERSARLLRELLRRHPEPSGLAADLVDCEHEGDRITHDIIHRLRRSDLRSAVEIADGHALAGALDDIVDHAEQVADCLGLYGIEAPMAQADDMADVLVAAGAEITGALGTLHSGADPRPHLVEINRLEDDGDRIYRDALASLFAAGIDPMVVIRWKDIFDSLERAVDACETVAHVLEGMSLKRHD
jgi:uncharacterized protein Yka (UPF0111/DUF47 family)